MIQRTVLSKESHHRQNELVGILSKLETFILEQYGKRTETEIINVDWLDEIIEAFYSGGRKADQLSFIDNYLEHYKLNILPFRKYRGKSITEGTKENHLTIITKFYDFLKTEKKRLKVSDYNIAVGNRFVTFFKRTALQR